MSGFNLLPWREVRNARKKKLIISILISIFIICIVCSIGIRLLLYGLLKNAAQESAYLEQHIISQDRQTGLPRPAKNAGLAMTALAEIAASDRENLSHWQTQRDHLLQQLLTLNTQALQHACLTDVQMMQHTIRLIGNTKSMLTLSKMLLTSSYLKRCHEVHVDSVTNNDQHNFVTFQITCY